MNKAIISILCLLTPGMALATDVPPTCNGVAISYEGSESGARHAMPESAYSISIQDDGEIYYVSVSVPKKYRELDLKQVNLQRLTSGEPVLSVGIDYEINGSKAVTKHALISPSELEVIKFGAFYGNLKECSEGYSYYQNSQAYDLDFKHKN